jgi:hypothetical protein
MHEVLANRGAWQTDVCHGPFLIFRDGVVAIALHGACEFSGRRDSLRANLPWQRTCPPRWYSGLFESFFAGDMKMRKLHLIAAAAAIAVGLSLATQVVHAANVPIVNPDFGGSGPATLAGWTVHTNGAGGGPDITDVYAYYGAGVEDRSGFFNLADFFVPTTA